MPKISIKFLIYIFVGIAFLMSARETHAHASPVGFSPDPKINITEAFYTISIKFTEKPDQNLSSLKIQKHSGEIIESTQIINQDEYTLSYKSPSPITEDVLIEWRVVSKDDGHYTNGSYKLTKSAAQSLLSEQTPIKHSYSVISTIGNIAEMLAFVFILSLFIAKIYSKQPKYYKNKILIAFAISAIGGLLILISHLIEVANISLSNILDNQFFILTSLRIFLSVLAFSSLFIFYKNDKLRNSIILFYLILFGIDRSFVSHANAQPFMPVLSSIITWIHMLSKFTWVSLILAFNVFLLRESRDRPFKNWLASYLDQQKYLYLILIIASLSGGYITWLHLKDPSNLFNSSWGLLMFFMLLLASGLFLVRIINIFFISKIKENSTVNLFQKIIFLIKAEAVLGVSLILLTALITQTSPPSFINGLASRLQTKDASGIQISTYPNSNDVLQINIPKLKTGTDPAISFIGQETGVTIQPYAQKITKNKLLINSNDLIPKQLWDINIQAQVSDGLDVIWRGTYDNKLQIPDPQKNRDIDDLALLISLGTIAIILFCIFLKYYSETIELKLESINMEKSLIQIKIEEKGIYFFVILILGLTYNLFFGQHGGHIGPLGAKLESICAKDNNKMQTRYIYHHGRIHSDLPAYGCFIESKNTHTNSLEEYIYITREL